MLQYLLLTKSNYVAWSINMHVNLQEPGVWNAIEHCDDIKEHKTGLTLVTIYQAILEDVLLMSAEKDSTKATWETLQTMHVDVE